MGIISADFMEDVKVSVTDLSKTVKRIEVLVHTQRANKIRQEILNEIRKKVKIKGFRPGKAPIEMLRLYYGDVIEEDYRRRLLEETFNFALKETNVEPLLKPVFEFVKRENEEGYLMDCEIIPQLEVPEYKGIEVEVKKTEIKDEEIEERLKNLQEMHAVIKEKEKEASAQMGDIAIIKYQGYIDGKPLKEAGTDYYPLELGKGIFMAEFENSIVGMKKGEEKEIEILFPQDYPDKEVAGKKVTFKVLLKELKEKVLPEISDEFAKDLNFESLDALKEELKKSIEREKDALCKEYVYRNLLDKILDGLTIPIPERYFKMRVEDLMEDMMERMREDNLLEEEKKKLKEEIEKRVGEEIKEEIVLLNIARAEKIEASEEEISEEIRRAAEETKRSYDDLRAFFEKNGLMVYIKNRVLKRKAREFLISHAKIKE